MPGPVTARETSAISRLIGRQGYTDIREQYRKEALLKWLRDREKRDTNVRPSR